MVRSAFVPSTWVGQTRFLRARPNVCLRSCPRRCPTTRRMRMSGSENLYPEVDPPESIENPVTPPATKAEASESPESLVEKLNARQRNRETASGVTSTILSPSIAEPEGPGVEQKTDRRLDFERAARALWRFGWATWWVQLILTVISAVILIFSFAFPGVNIRSSASAVGFIMSGAGVFVAFLSLFWTYSYTRLSLWLKDETKRTTERAQSRITGKLRFGLLISIAGLVISLTGLQAIVGTLLARLLSAGIATVPYNSYQGAPGPGGVAPGTGIVQPVDVLVVQASANAMMALLSALVTTVWLRARSKKWQGTTA